MYFGRQLVNQTIFLISRRKHYGGADWLENYVSLWRQNPLVAFFCRFVGKLRLIRHSDLILEYDDGESSNLFDFGEPEKAALGQPTSPLISGTLTSDQYMPLNQQRKA